MSKLEINQSTRKCPFCAEEIQYEAIKCRFCHSKLVPVNYSQIKWYRRQWFLILTFFFCIPLCILLLLSGPSYYCMPGRKVGKCSMTGRVCLLILLVLTLLVGMLSLVGISTIYYPPEYSDLYKPITDKDIERYNNVTTIPLFALGYPIGELVIGEWLKAMSELTNIYGEKFKVGIREEGYTLYIRIKMMKETKILYFTFACNKTTNKYTPIKMRLGNVISENLGEISVTIVTLAEMYAEQYPEKVGGE